jgi:AraC-like DNA-binding protein
MELIALMLEHCVFPPKKSSAPEPLNRADIERIRAAHEHILANMQSPPSLLSLARYVGLNDFKLKKGFRQVFGNSVFGCLHEHRMNQARRMLQDSNKSIKEISYAVGYKNAHSFSDAFKKYYGVRPSSYGT